MRFPEYLEGHIQNKEDIVKIADTIFGLTTQIECQENDAKEKNMTLLILSGLSGSGKDTIVQALLKKDSRFGWIKTCTTRLRRPEETEGNDPYIRLTEEAFQEALASGDVIEYIEYAGNHYCSLTSIFKKAFEMYRVPILRIDPKGSCFYLNKWREHDVLFDKVNLINVFVVPPSIETLEERLMNRSGDRDFVNKRIAQTMIDLPFVNEAEYIAINETGKLEAVVEDLEKLLLN
jgi:guanylate kinase